VRAGARIGAGCTLGKNVFVDAGVVIGDRTKVQNNVSVYAGVTLGDEVFVGPSAVFTNDRFPRAVSPGWEVVPTLVRRGASIGANATVVCGVEIGEYATVGAGAVLTRSLEPHELALGTPARRAGWVCTCGRVASRDHERPDDVRCEACRSGA
jgi:acetyltransferase-like isoleucine patch superfamily enzyme